MILIDSALKKREATMNPIRIGLIGCGVMGKGIVNQILHYHKGIQIVALYNRDENKAYDFLRSINYLNYAYAHDESELTSNFIQNKISVTHDVDVLLNSHHIELLIEVTGAIEFGMEVILKAFEQKKHVITFSAELESLFGPLLAYKAKSAGVKFTLADGDQPGVTVNLFRLVKSMGFKPLLCGNIKGMEDKYRTPLTQKKFADALSMSAHVVTSFADGTKINIEQASIANALGFKVAKRGMFGYETNDHVDNLTNLYDFDMLKENGGIVDYIIGGKPGPGVFVYATIDDNYSIRYLEYMKLGKGPLYSFYHPYHLLFFDIASTITRLIDFDDPVLLCGDKLFVNVITVAKKDLKKGEVIDGLGGFCTYGLCENNDIVMQEGLLPIVLAEGCKLKKDINIDQEIHFSDIEIPENDFRYKLWKEQIEIPSL